MSASSRAFLTPEMSAPGPNIQGMEELGAATLPDLRGDYVLTLEEDAVVHGGAPRPAGSPPEDSSSEDEDTEEPQTLAHRKARADEVALSSADQTNFEKLMQLPSMVRRSALGLIRNTWFDRIVLALVAINCVVLALDAPGLDPMSELGRAIEAADLFFVIVFAMEAGIKMLALGLINHNDAYFRSAWNWMDFLIVMEGIISTSTGGSGSFSGLRAFRVLRPLRTVSRLQGLKVIVNALISSLPLLLNTLIIVFFFFVVFGIIAVQIWSGAFQSRCFFVETGLLDVSDERLCGTDYACGQGRFCGRWVENPEGDVASFDNLLWAFNTIFACITMEGWSQIMYNAMDTLGWWSFIYFVFLIVFGSFILKNLTLAVILTKFRESVEDQEREKQVRLEIEAKRREAQRLAQAYWSMRRRNPRATMAIAASSAITTAASSKRSDAVVRSGSSGRASATPPGAVSRGESLTSPAQGMSPSSDVRAPLRSAMRSTAATPVPPSVAMSPSLGRDAVHVFHPDRDLSAAPGVQAAGVGSTVLSPGSESRRPLQRSAISFRLPGSRSSEDSAAAADEGGQAASATNGQSLRRTGSNAEMSTLQIGDRRVAIHQSGEFYTRHDDDEDDADDDEDDEENDGSQLDGSFRSSWISARRFIMSIFPRKCVRRVRVCYRRYLQRHVDAIDAACMSPVLSCVGRAVSTIQEVLGPIVRHAAFENTILVFIVANTIVLAIDHYGMSEQLNRDLDVANEIFTYIFLGEMLLKLAGLGVRQYLAEGFNRFDGFIVIISLVELGLGGSSSLAAFRAVRIARIMKIAKYLHSMQMIFRVVRQSLTSFGYIALLLLLFCFIYSVLGMQLFGGLFAKADELPRNNFDSLHWSFVTVFQILAGEAWNEIMYSVVGTSHQPAFALYFISWVIIGQFILLNLFLAVLLDNFSQDQGEDSDSEAPADVAPPHTGDSGAPASSGSRKAPSPTGFASRKVPAIADDDGGASTSAYSSVVEISGDRRRGVSFLAVGSNVESDDKQGAEVQVTAKSAGDRSRDVFASAVMADEHDALVVALEGAVEKPSVPALPAAGSELTTAGSRQGPAVSRLKRMSIAAVAMIAQSSAAVAKAISSANTSSTRSNADSTDSEGSAERRRHLAVALRLLLRRRRQMNSRLRTARNCLASYAFKRSRHEVALLAMLPPVVPGALSTDPIPDAHAHPLTDPLRVFLGEHASDAFLNSTDRHPPQYPTRGLTSAPSAAAGGFVSAGIARVPFARADVSGNGGPRRSTTMGGAVMRASAGVPRARFGSSGDPGSVVARGESSAAQRDNVDSDEMQHPTGRALSADLRRPPPSRHGAGSGSDSMGASSRNHDDRGDADDADDDDDDGDSDDGGDDIAALPGRAGSDDSGESGGSEDEGDEDSDDSPDGSDDDEDQDPTAVLERARRYAFEVSSVTAKEFERRMAVVLYRERCRIQSSIAAANASIGAPATSPTSSRTAIPQASGVPKLLPPPPVPALGMLPNHISTSSVTVASSQPASTMTSNSAVGSAVVVRGRVASATAAATPAFAAASGGERSSLRSIRTEQTASDRSLPSSSGGSEGAGASRRGAPLMVPIADDDLWMLGLNPHAPSMLDVPIDADERKRVMLANVVRIWKLQATGEESNASSISPTAGALAVRGIAPGSDEWTAALGRAIRRIKFMTDRDVALLTSEERRTRRRIPVPSEVVEACRKRLHGEDEDGGHPSSPLSAGAASPRAGQLSSEESSLIIPPSERAEDEKRAREFNAYRGNHMCCIARHGALATWARRIVRDAPLCSFRLRKGAKPRTVTFDNFILLVILVSSVMLAAEGAPPEVPPPIGTTWSSISEIVFTVIFAVEVILKVIAFGLVQPPGSYLRETWNVIDILVVVSSILNMVVTSALAGQSVNLGFLRTLRLLRSLRPLRVIARNEGMRVVVTALLRSVSGIVNVIVVLLLVWIMFAILGVQLFAGQLGHCNDPAFPPGASRWGQSNSTGTGWLVEPCTSEFAFMSEQGSMLPRQWVLPQPNFDDVLQGLLFLFVMSSGEDWPDVMFGCADATGVDRQPQRDNNPHAVWFFVAFIVVGSFFFLNLFTGVVFENFMRLKRELDASGMLTESQREWVRRARFVIKTRPERMTLAPKAKERARLWVFNMIRSDLFNTIMMVAISANVVILAISHDGEPPAMTTVLEGLNTFFSALFIGEALLKIYALGFGQYMSDGWNVFDLVVVAGSVVDLALSDSGTAIIGKIFRILRVLRVLRLARAITGLRRLIVTLVAAVPSLANVGSLLMLLFFIYAIMGVQSFGSVPDGRATSEQANFRTFGLALLTLFRMSTGEAWDGFMYDASEAQHTLAWIYFVSFVMIASFIALNLFITIIIEEFETSENESDGMTEAHVRAFKIVWRYYDPEGSGRMPVESLESFLRHLPPPMGFSGAAAAGGSKSNNPAGRDSDYGDDGDDDPTDEGGADDGGAGDDEGPGDGANGDVVGMGMATGSATFAAFLRRLQELDLDSHDGFVFFNEVLSAIHRTSFNARVPRQLQKQLRIDSRYVKSKVSKKALRQKARAVVLREEIASPTAAHARSPGAVGPRSRTPVKATLLSRIRARVRVLSRGVDVQSLIELSGGGTERVSVARTMAGIAIRNAFRAWRKRARARQRRQAEDTQRRQVLAEAEAEASHVEAVLAASRQTGILSGSGADSFADMSAVETSPQPPAPVVTSSSTGVVLPPPVLAQSESPHDRTDVSDLEATSRARSGLQIHVAEDEAKPAADTLTVLGSPRSPPPPPPLRSTRSGGSEGRASFVGSDGSSTPSGGGDSTSTSQRRPPGTPPPPPPPRSRDSSRNSSRSSSMSGSSSAAVLRIPEVVMDTEHDSDADAEPWGGRARSLTAGPETSRRSARLASGESPRQATDPSSPPHSPPPTAVGPTVGEPPRSDSTPQVSAGWSARTALAASVIRGSGADLASRPPGGVQAVSPPSSPRASSVAPPSTALAATSVSIDQTPALAKIRAALEAARALRTGAALPAAAAVTPPPNGSSPPTDPRPASSIAARLGMLHSLARTASSDASSDTDVERLVPVASSSGQLQDRAASQPSAPTSAASPVEAVDRVRSALSRIQALRGAIHASTGHHQA